SKSIVHSFSGCSKIEKPHSSFGQPRSNTSLPDPKRPGSVVRFPMCDFVRATYGTYLFDFPQVPCPRIPSCNGSVYLFGELAAQSSSYVIRAAARAFRTGIGLTGTVARVRDGAERIDIDAC